MPPLQLSPDRRRLQTADGRTFFWLADTAWELFHRCDEVEVQRYLQHRAAQGFNVVQAVVLAEADGLHAPNHAGYLPFVDRDPTRPVEGYFRHVDYTIDLANRLGLYVAVLPTWGKYVGRMPWYPQGERNVFTAASAHRYGRFLGARYRERGVVWVLGGDRPWPGSEDIYRAMARGLREGGAEQPMTYHPIGPGNTATMLPDEPWLDFHFVQSGHSRRWHNNHDLVALAYRAVPTRPVIDGEPCYEKLPVGFHPQNGYFEADDVRRAAWQSVMAGAAGHTYGCNNIWQMWKPGRQPLCWCTPEPWSDCLHLPGANQMRWLRRCFESRPFGALRPDTGVLVRRDPFPDYDDATHSIQHTDRCFALHDAGPDRRGASTIVVYLPMALAPTLDTTAIAGRRLRPWWFDPRTGLAFPQPIVENTGTYEPAWHWRPWQVKLEGVDWVLVVDDADAGYPPPGQS